MKQEVRISNGGPFPFFDWLDLNCSTMPLNDSLTDPETKTRPFPFSFCCKERIENLWKNLLGFPFPVSDML